MQLFLDDIHEFVERLWEYPLLIVLYLLKKGLQWFPFFVLILKSLLEHVYESLCALGIHYHYKFRIYFIFDHTWKTQHNQFPSFQGSSCFSHPIRSPHSYNSSSRHHLNRIQSLVFLVISASNHLLNHFMAFYYLFLQFPFQLRYRWN